MIMMVMMMMMLMMVMMMTMTMHTMAIMAIMIIVLIMLTMWMMMMTTILTRLTMITMNVTMIVMMDMAAVLLMCMMMLMTMIVVVVAMMFMIIIIVVVIRISITCLDRRGGDDYRHHCHGSDDSGHDCRGDHCDRASLSCSHNHHIDCDDHGDHDDHGDRVALDEHDSHDDCGIAMIMMIRMVTFARLVTVITIITNTAIIAMTVATPAIPTIPTIAMITVIKMIKMITVITRITSTTREQYHRDDQGVNYECDGGDYADHDDHDDDQDSVPGGRRSVVADQGCREGCAGCRSSELCIQGYLGTCGGAVTRTFEAGDDLALACLAVQHFQDSWSALIPCCEHREQDLADWPSKIPTIECFRLSRSRSFGDVGARNESGKARLAGLKGSRPRIIQSHEQVHVMGTTWTGTSIKAIRRSISTRFCFLRTHLICSPSGRVAREGVHITAFVARERDLVCEEGGGDGSEEETRKTVRRVEKEHLQGEDRDGVRVVQQEVPGHCLGVGGHGAEVADGRGSEGEDDIFMNIQLLLRDLPRDMLEERKMDARVKLAGLQALLNLVVSQDFEDH